MKEIRYKIGKEIQNARLEQNISQTALSEMAGVDRKTLYNIEAGAFSARLDVIEKIANELGLTLTLKEK